MPHEAYIKRLIRFWMMQSLGHFFGEQDTHLTLAFRDLLSESGHRKAHYMMVELELMFMPRVELSYPSLSMSAQSWTS